MAKKKTEYTPGEEKRGQVLIEKWGRFQTSLQGSVGFYTAFVPELGEFEAADTRILKEKIMDALKERGR